MTAATAASTARALCRQHARPRSLWAAHSPRPNCSAALPAPLQSRAVRQLSKLAFPAGSAAIKPPRFPAFAALATHGYPSQHALTAPLHRRSLTGSQVITRNQSRTMCMCSSSTSSPYVDTTAHDALPKTVKPSKYAIQLFDIDVESHSFKGQVDITLDVKEDTNEIVLHQKFLKITKALALYSLTKTEVEYSVTDVKHDEKAETVTLTLSETVKSGGILKLALWYTGKIRTDMAGFYSSTFEDEKDNNKTKYILSTQFEATDARSAFPCYDEPNAKAVFDLQITAPDSHTVIANTPIVSEKTLDDGKKGSSDTNSLKTVTFETTPIMSTYLLAWAIGEFEYIEANTKRSYNGKPVPVRVYTVPGKTHTGEFALSVATRAIDLISEIFKIDYVLPKMDMLAVPQFSAGAMENWGLVTYRSSALLFDPKTSDDKFKKSICYVVSHELVHQWFGNLVTMDWWNELWLNEGFATWVGWYVVDNLYPEWNTFTEFVSDSTETALGLDGLRSSHPIEVPVYYSYEVDQVFDHISYLKGGSCIRMLAESIGTDVFLKGVANYLNKHKFGNAKTIDLWNGISEVAGQDINAIMEPWIKAQGYPYVYVEQIPNSANEYKLTQKRFLTTNDTTPEENATKWWIPLGIYPDFPNAPKSFNTETTTIKVESDEGFFKLNRNTVGFYRVVYEQKILDDIIANFDKLSPEDKIGLIADTASGANAGLIPTSSLLSLLTAVKNEDDYAVWLEITARLGKLSTVFYEDKEISDALDKFGISVLEKKTNELLNSNINDDSSVNEKSFKALLFASSGTYGLQTVIDESTKLFKNGKIPPYLKGGIYRTLLGNEETCIDEYFNYILNDVKNPSSPDARETALKSLGAIANVDKFYETVISLLFTPAVPEQDIFFLTASLARNQKTKKLFWEYIKSNFTEINGKLAQMSMDRLMKGLLPALNSKEYLKDIESFLEGKDEMTKNYNKGIAQSLDSIKSSVKYAERDTEDVRSWLSKNKFI